MRELDLSEEEVVRRLRTASMLSDTVRRLRAAALEAYERGEIDWKPQQDIRSDYRYWKNLLDQSLAGESCHSKDSAPPSTT